MKYDLIEYPILNGYSANPVDHDVKYDGKGIVTIVRPIGYVTA